MRKTVELGNGQVALIINAIAKLGPTSDSVERAKRDLVVHWLERAEKVTIKLKN